MKILFGNITMKNNIENEYDAIPKRGQVSIEELQAIFDECKRVAEKDRQETMKEFGITVQELYESRQAEREAMLFAIHS